MAIRIPQGTGEATHCTSGLSGYPAIDFFGDLGEDVYIGEPGELFDSHLIAWHQGFGGWTFYYLGDSGGRYFVTHLDEGFQARPGRYIAGQLVGHLTWSADHAALINGAHVHVGNTHWTGPGLHCGALPTNAHRAGGSVPRTQFRSNPPSKVAAAKNANAIAAWHHLGHALGSTVPTQARRSRLASRNFTQAIR